MTAAARRVRFIPPHEQGVDVALGDHLVVRASLRAGDIRLEVEATDDVGRRLMASSIGKHLPPGRRRPRRMP